MSESSSSQPLAASAELVKWLQSLALPLWARVALIVAFFGVFVAGLSLVAWGLIYRERESLVAAIGLLTVAMPVSLVVVALVFGQQSEKRLATAVRRLLSRTIVDAIQTIAATPRRLHMEATSLHGCRGVYRLSALDLMSGTPVPLRFTVEVNISKANIGFFWVDAADHLDDPVNLDAPALQAYRHVIEGAIAEGYAMNTHPARYGTEGEGDGVLFSMRLDDDFLLSASRKLYFAQDLAFFVRGMLEARLDQLTQASDLAPERETIAQASSAVPA